MTNEFYDLLLSCAENQASKSKDDFVHGGICAIRELWHGAEEEPEGGTDIHRDIISSQFQYILDVFLSYLQTGVVGLCR